MLSLLLFFSRESLNSGCNYTYNDTLRCKQEAQDENFNSKKTRVSRGHPYNSLSGFRFTRHCLVLSLVMWPISKISAKFLWVPGQILLSCAIRTALTQVMRMYTFIPRFKGFQIIRFLNWYCKKTLWNGHNARKSWTSTFMLMWGRRGGGGSLRLVQKKRHNDITRT